MDGQKKGLHWINTNLRPLSAYEVRLKTCHTSLWSWHVDRDDLAVGRHRQLGGHYLSAHWCSCDLESLPARCCCSGLCTCCSNKPRKKEHLQSVDSCYMHQSGFEGFLCLWRMLSLYSSQSIMQQLIENGWMEITPTTPLNMDKRHDLSNIKPTTIRNYLLSLPFSPVFIILKCFYLTSRERTYTLYIYYTSMWDLYMAWVYSKYLSLLLLCCWWW